MAEGPAIKTENVAEQETVQEHHTLTEWNQGVHKSFENLIAEKMDSQFVYVLEDELEIKGDNRWLVLFYIRTTKGSKYPVAHYIVAKNILNKECFTKLLVVVLSAVIVKSLTILAFIFDCEKLHIDTLRQMTLTTDLSVENCRIVIQGIRIPVLFDLVHSANALNFDISTYLMKPLKQTEVNDFHSGFVQYCDKLAERDDIENVDHYASIAIGLTVIANIIEFNSMINGNLFPDGFQLSFVTLYEIANFFKEYANSNILGVDSTVSHLKTFFCNIKTENQN